MMAARIAGYEGRRKNLHVACQHQQIDAVLGQQFELPRLRLRPRGSGSWRVDDRDSVKSCHRANVAMI